MSEAGSMTNELAAKQETKTSDVKNGGLTPKELSIRSSPLQWSLFCFALYLGGFLYGLDTTIAADVQGSIYEAFGNLGKLAWVGTGFPMGSAAVLLLVGVSFGLFNTKWLLISFFALFEIGSAVCGASPSIDALIVGRVLAGVGGAGLYVGALTYVQAFTTLKERPLYNAVAGLAWGIGAILGPAIGGAFAVHATWRWAFYLNLPIAGLVAPIYIFLFPDNTPLPVMSASRKLAGIDWLGAFLNASTFVLFITALTSSGSIFAWSSGASIALWTTFAVSLIAFIAQQSICFLTTQDCRLFPAHLLGSRTMLTLFLVTASSSTALGVTLYYVPLLFQFTRNDSALEAAIRLLPFIIPEVFMTMLNGALLPVTKRYAPWYMLGGIFILIAGSLLYQISVTTSTAAIYGFEVLAAVGSGITFQVAYSVAAAKLRGRDIPAGIGFVNVAQIGSLAIALSIAGCIFQNVGSRNLENTLAGHQFSQQTLRAALAGIQSQVSEEFNGGVQRLVVAAVVKTIRTVFVLEIAAGALMILAAGAMRWEALNMNPAAGA